MSGDLITDIGFAMCLIGLIIIILSGLLLPPHKEHVFNKMIILGSVISVVGGLIIVARIV